MAYFECTIGGGDYEPLLIVTCSSEFAGLPITCSDGETTLIDNCPSAAPYEIEFSLPNYGEWTISGTVSGYTITESILVQAYGVELNYATDITVDLYSAANDTVSYIGTDGNTHTVTTDSTGHAVTTITGISPTTPSITFTSSVAKDPNNLSNYYTKSVTLTSATSSVYLMPDNALYWFGYVNTTFTKDSSIVETRNINSITITNSVSLAQPKAFQTETVPFANKTAKMIVLSSSLGRYSASSDIWVYIGGTTVERTYQSAIPDPRVLQATPTQSGTFKITIQTYGELSSQITFAAMWYE